MSVGTDPGAAVLPIPLLAPVEGVPPVTADAVALSDVVARFAAGHGPVAVDAERASGYRYSQRAYLVQLRRRGAGTALIDPIVLPDLSSLQDVIGEQEWVLHAANQDLACLAEVGLVPARVFDTELAGRLVHLPRTGLGVIVETMLGFSLEKGHSAADWSTRPLPEPWLRYAALDVELLVELRDVLEARLREQGKWEWAQQEFAAVLTARPAAPRAEPWRRTSGIHRARGRRQLAAVRSLWQARDAVARRRDIAPGRVLPDTAVMTASTTPLATEADLVALPVFGGPRMRRSSGVWWAALQEAQGLPDRALPSASPVADGPPAAARWADKDPEAALRLARLRAALATIAEEQDLPVENLLEPAAVRALAWAPPASITLGTVIAALQESRARGWQVDLVADALTHALPPPEPTEQ